MDVPAFPATESDLAEWEVYADWLQSKGDPRGELIAHELALPVAPEREPLAAFHQLAKRSCKQGRRSLIAWCLGHARTLTILGWRRSRLQPPLIEHGTLANVRDLLLGPIGSRLEELTCAYVPDVEPKGWRRMFSALPPTCRRVKLTLAGRWSEHAVGDVMAWLPPTVEELALESTFPPMNVADHLARFVSDRFAVIELVRYPADASDRLVEAVAVTRTVRLRVNDLELARRLAPDRRQLGSPAAAGLVSQRSVAVLEPWPLILLQRRNGVMPVRAQLARDLPEDHVIGVDARGNIRSSWASADLVRRGWCWTIRASDVLRVWERGRPLDLITELDDGDQLEIQQISDQLGESPRVHCTFRTRDLDRI